MSTPLTDSINALTTYANEVTGGSDTNLSDAVHTLASGYGGGEVFTDGNWGLPYTKDFVVGNINGMWNDGESPLMGMSHLETIEVQSTNKWGGGGASNSGRTVKTFANCTSLKKVSLPFIQGFGNGYNEGQVENCDNLEEFTVGSVGHPVTAGMGQTSGPYMIFRNNTASFNIIIYANAETLADVPSVLKNGAPWGATNATVIYKSSNTGEILQQKGANLCTHS